MRRFPITTKRKATVSHSSQKTIQKAMATPITLSLLLFSFSVVVVVFASGVIAQSLPPPRQDGFVYTDHPVDSDTVVIEAFLDPVCPDSRDAWPPLKQALQHYGPRVWLVVHLLPLPYHDNAYAASRALHIVNALNTSATFHLLEMFFMQQERFYNDQTKNMSRAAIVNSIVKFAAQVVGNSCYSSIASGFNDRKTDLKTRVSFKYSTSKGVYGTPSFFLNGFLLPDADSTIDYNGWRRFIDPLIAAQRQ